MSTHAELSVVGIKLLFIISDEWGLNQSQILSLSGLESLAEMNTWCERVVQGQEVSFPNDILERLSYIVGIYSALYNIFPSKQQRSMWIKKPNDYFDENSALSLMMAKDNEGMAIIRRYLDAASQALYT